MMDIIVMSIWLLSIFSMGVMLGASKFKDN
jgi:hypothetical protein